MKKQVLTIISILFLLGCNNETKKSEISTSTKELKDILCEVRKAQQNIDFTKPIANHENIGIVETKKLKDIISSIMKDVGNNNFYEAFEKIKKYTWISDKEIDIAYKSTDKQLKLIGNRYGEFIGYEFVSQTILSKSLIQFVYIAKGKNHPLVWSFIFYKAKDKWTLNDFYWHDKLRKLN